MDSTQKAPHASERTHGSPAGGNGHHVWTVEEKEAFEKVMWCWGCEWDRKTLTWRQFHAGEHASPFWVADGSVVGDALRQNAPWRFR
jgi:hypothetical protein